MLGPSERLGLTALVEPEEMDAGELEWAEVSHPFQEAGEIEEASVEGDVAGVAVEYQLHPAEAGSTEDPLRRQGVFMR